jgi:hypothetical protein
VHRSNTEAEHPFLKINKKVRTRNRLMEVDIDGGGRVDEARGAEGLEDNATLYVDPRVRAAQM